MSNSVLSCENLVKTYQDGSLHVEVIRQLNLNIQAGESVSISGSSGSGKSTLLHLLGGLDKADSGTVTLMGKSLSQLSPKAIGQWRNQHLGFVYQFHHLLPEFSALENVMMPLSIARKDEELARNTALEMLDKVGLKNRAEHRPSELSGGERQRAAIARALVMRPACVLADEPTGNLDKKNAANVLHILLELKNELQTALLVVTHDEDQLSYFDRSLKMDDGKLISL
ncbi:MAG: lipoprotein-releasing ABC transporter ATP-binding protein LolD [Neisseriaceae bacterium]|nr:lipoprotein-releasing ABC transporter ATP-binding protein LolD [Neisseriaceae bacterium]